VSVSYTFCQLAYRWQVRPLNGFLQIIDVDVDVVDLRAQADASMPASNNNVKLYNISNF